MPDRRFSGLPAGGIVALLFWLVPVAIAWAICRNTISLADLGWQLQLGRLMMAQGPFLREPFVATHLGEALVPNAWLAQIGYAHVLDAIGWKGLRALDAVIWLAGPILAIMPALRRATRPLSLLVALAIGLAVALPSATIRPQSFASLGFGLTLVMLYQVRSWRTALAVGLPLFVLWQNLHPSVPIAALTIGAVAALRWVRHGLGQGDRPLALTVLALVAGVAVLATPAGFAIIAFARTNAMASHAFGATEWLPLWDPYQRYALCTVLASGLVVLAVAIRHRHTVTDGEVVPVLVTFAMAMSAERFMLFYAIAIIPLLARMTIGSAPPRTHSLRRIGIGLATCAALVVAVSLWLPVRPERANGRAVFAALAHTAPHGVVFTDPVLGGAVIDGGYPGWTVAFDGRYYLYRSDEAALSNRTNSDPGTLDTIERRYHPCAYALIQASSPALVRALAAQPAIWRRAYDNGTSVLFVRTDRPFHG